MISNNTTAPAGLGCRGLSPRAPAFNHRAAAAVAARRVVVRFKENESNYSELPQARNTTDTKLNKEQLEELFNKQAGQFSPRTAEMRADLGRAAATDLNLLSTFDGPAPETINGRLAMLGTVIGLLVEASTGQGLLQQTANHPIVVFLIYAIISIATYVPLTKGYTRKEPFANRFLDLDWTPKAENWNGRLAMLGFTGMILTEFITGVTTLQAWGLQ